MPGAALDQSVAELLVIVPVPQFPQRDGEVVEPVSEPALAEVDDPDVPVPEPGIAEVQVHSMPDMPPQQVSRANDNT